MFVFMEDMRWRSFTWLLVGLAWLARTSAAEFAAVTELANILPGTDQVGALAAGETFAPFRSYETNTVALAAQTFLTRGDPEQWRFFSFSNSLPLSYLVFATFPAGRIPPKGPPLNCPGLEPEPDLDLYVSTDPGLTNLEAGALVEAGRSTSRGGTELVLLTNVQPGQFYLAIKCESPEGAEFGVLAYGRNAPFTTADPEGPLNAEGFVISPEAAPSGQATVAYAFAVVPEPGLIRRLVVSNTVSGTGEGLTLSLVHGPRCVVLKDRTGVGEWIHEALVFDDSPEADLSSAARADGPGSLRDLGGREGQGLWVAALSTTNLPARLERFSFQLQPQAPLDGATVIVPAHGCREDFFKISPESAGLLMDFWLCPGPGPVTVQLCRPGWAGQSQWLGLDEARSRGALELSPSSYPPLNPGIWSIILTNSGAEDGQISLSISRHPGEAVLPSVAVQTMAPAVISDNAVSSAVLEVSQTGTVASAQVAVLIHHPRPNDLELRLVSPSGRSGLLSAQRGGSASGGLGCDLLVTNPVPVFTSGGPEASTNLVETGRPSGTLLIDYDFLGEADRMTIYHDGRLILDTGPVSGAGHTNVDYGPGGSTAVLIVMNEGGAVSEDTVWLYTARSVYTIPIPLRFTDQPLLAEPVKFAGPRLTNITWSLDDGTAQGICYLPEQSLSAFHGEPSAGSWRLEIQDTRAGPAGAAPALAAAELSLCLERANPAPSVVTLTNWIAFQPQAVLAPGGVNYYRFEVPEGSVRAQFEVEQPTSDLTLAVRRGLPLPTIENWDYLSSNASSNSELTVVYDFSRPVPLTSGEWYLAVLNESASPALYSVRAGVGVEYGTNTEIVDLEIVNSNLCLTWASLPGAHYYVLGRADGEVGDWLPISAEIIAEGLTTRWCGPLSGGSGFFRVVEGLLLFPPPLMITRVGETENGPQLAWNAPANTRFRVEWSPSLEAPRWQTFTNPIPSTGTNYLFLDDGLGAGGFEAQRFYRLRWLPGPAALDAR